MYTLLFCEGYFLYIFFGPGGKESLLIESLPKGFIFSFTFYIGIDGSITYSKDLIRPGRSKLLVFKKIVQCNPDLVTHLVCQKSVTKSRGVTK